MRIYPSASITTFDEATIRAIHSGYPKGFRAGVQNANAPLDIGLLIVRMASGIVFSNDGQCWLWVRRTNRGGYGDVSVSGQMLRAHRVAYALAKGPIPEGLVVMHSCDVRNCVNPAHLSVGTSFDNANDAARKGHMKSGVLVLTPDDARNIFSLVKNGESQSSVARKYGLVQSHVSQIMSGYLWSKATRGLRETFNHRSAA